MPDVDRDRVTVGGSRLLESAGYRARPPVGWTAILPVTLFYQGRVVLLNEDMGLLRGAT
jgi:hypothetical protein